MGNKSSASADSSGGGKENLDDLVRETNMSKEELKDLMATFKKMADKNGLVGKDQFREAIKKKYGAENSSTLVYAIFNLFDKDSSKTVDFREFVMALQFLTNPSVDDAIEICFRCIDLNNDGSITRGELREVMLTNAKLKKYINVYRRSGSMDAVQLTPTEVSNINHEADQIFEQMDVDKSKSIQFDEFVLALSKDAELKERVSQLMMAEETKNLFK